MSVKAERYLDFVINSWSENAVGDKFANGISKQQDDGRVSSRKYLDIYRNWIQRAIFGALLISYFLLTIHLGPIAIVATTLAIQIKCYFEVTEVVFKISRLENLRHLRLLSSYFLFTTNYFCCGENLQDFFKKSDFNWMFSYHRLVAFLLHCLGLFWFSSNLSMNFDDKSNFQVLAWIHMSLILLVLQSHMIVKNILQGMIWVIMPVSVVVINDMMAFLFGKFFGRTPLILVSPKKTWEGYLGGGVTSVAFGCLISYYLQQDSYFICPIEMDSLSVGTNCTEFASECWIFMLHCFVISLFGSTLAPFGGFFASGFKRAFDVKDFGNTIPGHGGVLDRFDCHFITATFVHVYVSCFVRNNDEVGEVFSKLSELKVEQQLEVFELLKHVIKK